MCAASLQDEQPNAFRVRVVGGGLFLGESNPVGAAGEVPKGRSDALDVGHPIAVAAAEVSCVHGPEVNTVAGGHARVRDQRGSSVSMWTLTMIPPGLANDRAADGFRASWIWPDHPAASVTGSLTDRPPCDGVVT